jgi:hypothetical protein
LPPIPPVLAPPSPPAPPDPPLSPELLEEVLDEPLAELVVSDPVPPDELPSSVPVAHAQRDSKRADQPLRKKRMNLLYALAFDGVKRDGQTQRVRIAGLLFNPDTESQS